MNTRFRSLQTHASVAALLMGTALLAVQQANAQGRLEEVVVTAQKRQEVVNEIGMSITALSGDALEQRGIFETSELAKAVPGLTFSQAPRGTPIFAIRGVGFDDSTLGSNPTVALYVDEVPLTFPVMARFAAMDLERVEVLKGPQGTLFGQNSTAGAINFIAAKPTQEFSAGVTASYGRFDSKELHGFVSGPLSDSFRARLALKTLQADDWQSSYSHGGSLGEKDQTAARLLAEWDVTEKLTLNFNVNGWQDKSDTQASQLLAIAAQIPTTIVPAVNNYPRAPRNARDADWDANPREPLSRDDKFWQAAIRADYEINDSLTFTSISAWSRYDQDYTVDSDGTPFQVFTLGMQGEIKSFNQEFRLAGSTDSVEWIVGVNYSDDEAYDSTFYTFPDSSFKDGFLGIDEAISTADQPIENRAVFANAKWSVNDTVSINGGIRYTEDEREYEGCTNDSGNGKMAYAYNIVLGLTGTPNEIQPGGCTSSRLGIPTMARDKLKEDNVSWRLGVDWQMNYETLLYATVSKGYKSGSFPAVNSADVLQLNPVTQEEILAYEVGFKAGLLDGNAQLNASAFYYDYKDKQLRGRILDPFGAFGILETLMNIPESRVYGLEADFTIAPADGLTLALAATWVDSEVTGDFYAYDPVGNLFNYKGQEFPQTPEWNASASVNYEMGLNDRLAAFAGVDVTYQSATTSLFHDRDLVGSVEGSPILNPGETLDRDVFEVRDFTTVDARIGVRDDTAGWSAWLWGRNLTDTYYWTNVTQSADTIYRLAAMPRTYGVSFSYEF